VDAGRLTSGSGWTVSVVFVPHEALPYGVPEAHQIAEDVAAIVEGSRV